MGSDNLNKFEMQPGYSTAINFIYFNSYKVNQFVLFFLRTINWLNTHKNVDKFNKVTDDLYF